MCLLSKTNKPMVAKKDIICYKELASINNGEIYRTPYQGIFLANDIINGERPFIASGKKSIELVMCDGDTRRFCENYFSIGGGYIHTYSDKYCQRNFGSLGRCLRHKDYAFFKCIIPKGTEYFISSDEHKYASEKIIFQKQITNFQLYKEHFLNWIVSFFKKD